MEECGGGGWLSLGKALGVGMVGESRRDGCWERRRRSERRESERRSAGGSDFQVVGSGPSRRAGGFNRFSSEQLERTFGAAQASKLGTSTGGHGRLTHDR